MDKHLSTTPRALVTGAGDFIAHHLVSLLKDRGYWVRGVDLKRPEYAASEADEFLRLDLRRRENCFTASEGTEEVYAMAANMMRSDYRAPLNLGQDRMVTIDQLADLIAAIAGIDIRKKHGARPTGRARAQFRQHPVARGARMEPSISLDEALRRTYRWDRGANSETRCTHSVRARSRYRLYEPTTTSLEFPSSTMSRKNRGAARRPASVRETRQQKKHRCIENPEPNE